MILSCFCGKSELCDRIEKSEWGFERGRCDVLGGKYDRDVR